MNTHAPSSVKEPVADQPTAPRYVAQVSGVRKRYGATQALDGAEITIRPGTAHALVGRNGAGKSTLVGVLTGMVDPDQGEVLVQDRALTAIERLQGDDVACVYQRPQILDDLTVAENLFIGQWPSTWVGRRSLHRKAKDVLKRWGIRVDSRLLARQLDVEQRQLVEIARALTGGPALVILDEPTAQLDRHASERLFQRLDEMKAQGVSFLFISHHLEEIFRVCEEVTVMRDGRTVAAGVPVTSVTARDLVDLMVGEDAAHAAPENTARRTLVVDSAAAPLLDVAGISSKAGLFSDITFQVRAGEIVAIAGLGGSGKREVGQAIVGLHPREGAVRIDGAPLRPDDVKSSIQAGVGYVPEDRHASGFAPHLSIADNITTSVMGRFGPLGWINRRRRDVFADEMIADLDIVPARRAVETGGLSGGNQQKVVMGRALAASPRVIVGITPTAGVDVASKTFLYGRLERAASDGSGVLLISDEIDELALADRVLVVFEGQIRAEFPRGWAPGDLIAAMEGVGLDPITPTDTEEGHRK